MNPKDKIGRTKLPLWIFPPIGILYGTMALIEGAIKYGPYNWRKVSISEKEYVSALDRHVQTLKSGQRLDHNSKVSQLAHIIATATIMLDAEFHGTLVADIPEGKNLSDLLEQLRNHPLMQEYQERGFAVVENKEEKEDGRKHTYSGDRDVGFGGSIQKRTEEVSGNLQYKRP